MTTPFSHFFETPIGWVAVAQDPQGRIQALQVWEAHPSSATQPLDPAPRADRRVMSALRSQLDGYFKGTCQTFNAPLLLAGGEFELKVWNELLTLPYGRCVDIQVLAQRVGAPEELRAVAVAIRANPIAILIPSHRVLGWESIALARDPDGWLDKLRLVENIRSGETTCLMISSLPSTPADLARAAARAPSVRFRKEG